MSHISNLLENKQRQTVILLAISWYKLNLILITFCCIFLHFLITNLWILNDLNLIFGPNINACVKDFQMSKRYKPWKRFKKYWISVCSCECVCVCVYWEPNIYALCKYILNVQHSIIGYQIFIIIVNFNYKIIKLYLGK